MRFAIWRAFVCLGILAEATGHGHASEGVERNTGNIKCGKTAIKIVDLFACFVEHPDLDAIAVIASGSAIKRDQALDSMTGDGIKIDAKMYPTYVQIVVDRVSGTLLKFEGAFEGKKFKGVSGADDECDVRIHEGNVEGKARIGLPFESERLSIELQFATPMESSVESIDDRPIRQPKTRQGLGEKKTDASSFLVTSPVTGLEMIRIPAGEFSMGNPQPNKKRKRDDVESPHHRVRISRSFLLGRFEVTEENLEKVIPMGCLAGSGYWETFRTHWGPRGIVKSKKLPLDRISWYRAIELCNAMSRVDRYPEFYSLMDVKFEDGHMISATVSVKGGVGYRLPTEAEWEYACRAGTSSPYHFGSILNGDEANVDGNRPFGTTEKGGNLNDIRDVGTYAANAFGLYDMHGNVAEWCGDAYEDDTYKARIGLTIDPLVVGKTGYRIARGGSWRDPPRDARSASRGVYHESSCLPFLGLRVARNIADTK